MEEARHLLSETISELALGDAGAHRRRNSSVDALFPALLSHKLEFLLFNKSETFRDVALFFTQIYEAQVGELKRMGPRLDDIQTLSLIQGFSHNIFLGSVFGTPRRKNIDLSVERHHGRRLDGVLKAEGYINGFVADGRLVEASVGDIEDYEAQRAYQKSFPYIKPVSLRGVDIVESEHDYFPVVRLADEPHLVQTLQVTHSIRALYGSPHPDRSTFASIRASDLDSVGCQMCVRFHYLYKTEKRMRIVYDFARIAFSQDEGRLRLFRIFDLLLEDGRFDAASLMLNCIGALSKDVMGLVQELGLPCDPSDSRLMAVNGL